MSEVKRFKTVINDKPYKPYAYCTEDAEGNYVRYEDYAALQQKLDVLASLTGEPVEYRVLREDGGIASHCATLEDAQATVKNWNKCWTIQPVYASPPAPTLRLPDEVTAEDVRWMLKQQDHGDGPKCRVEHAEEIGAKMWNACREDAARLNATAPQPVKLPKYTQEVYPNHLLENQKIKSRNEAIGECADAIRAAGYKVEG